MKFLSILAAASLALTPAIADAASGDEGRVLKDSEVPAGAIILGALVILGGVVIGILAGGDSNNNTNN
jgi:hypothetical protein